MVVIMVLIAGFVIALLEISDTTHFFHKPNTPMVTASSETKGENGTDKTQTTKTTSSKVNENDQSSGSVQPGDNKSGTGSDVPVVLLAPTGNFVSAHKADQAASLSSVCNTTPGVSCQIVFTQNGVVKSLPIQTTDRGGSVYWNGWTPKSIGLVPGTWQVQAVASQGQQSKLTTDALPLEVTL